MRLLIIRQIYLINFYRIDFYWWWYVKEKRNWNGFLDFLGIEDNLRIEEYIFDEGGSKKFLVLKKNNKGGKKDIINSLIIQAKNK